MKFKKEIVERFRFTCTMYMVSTYIQLLPDNTKHIIFIIDFLKTLEFMKNEL